MLLLPMTLLLASTLISTTFATYILSQDYTGSNFYAGFDFQTFADPTQGHVQFLSMIDANETQIAGLLDGGNSTMAVFLGVDSQNVAPVGRNSHRVQSNQGFQHGLFIADIAHMPGGICGVWPAFWMVGPDWPTNGEIDIVEGVNDQATNSMTLHTGADIVMENSTSLFSGVMQTANCNVNAPDQGKNVGCSIMADSEITYGTGFNAGGGGTYATEWTSASIKIWFFLRGTVPADITAGTPSPSDAWGPPASAFEPTPGFSMDDHFSQMNIIFDTTFCGQWAGVVWNQSSTCASLAPTCDDYVANNPSAFTEAFWAINSLQVFQENGSSSETNNTQIESNLQDLSQSSFTDRKRGSVGGLMPRRHK